MIEWEKIEEERQRIGDQERWDAEEKHVYIAERRRDIRYKLFMCLRHSTSHEKGPFVAWRQRWDGWRKRRECRAGRRWRIYRMMYDISWTLKLKPYPKSRTAISVLECSTLQYSALSVRSADFDVGSVAPNRTPLFLPLREVTTGF